MQNNQLGKNAQRSIVILYVSTTTPKSTNIVGRYRRKTYSLLDSYVIFYHISNQNIQSMAVVAVHPFSI